MTSQNPILFFRLAYMKDYGGVGDITGGGSYIEEYGEGGEMWNFRPEGGRCYGFVMTSHYSGIDLSRIDDSRKWKANDESDGIDIVFFAKKPDAGQVVVGWYKGATVFHRQYRKRPGVKKGSDWDNLEYLCEVDSERATLLPESARTFEIPYAPARGEGYPGISNVWYGDSDSKNAKDLVSRVRKYIGQGQSANPTAVPRKAKKGAVRPSSFDKTLIPRIEQAAIDITWAHYDKIGYVLESVEKDNRGWDLEASKNGKKLYLEVKGHIGNVIQFELTPREYMKLQEHSSVYRVCVVRSALGAPDLMIFTPRRKNGRWSLVSDTNSVRVQLSEKVAARASEV